MYKGSLVGAGFNVFAVWNYVITNTHFGVIELNPKLLAAILGGEIGEVESAIEFLCKPDAESRSKDEEGRRLVKEGQFQYRVVNWAEYQKLRSEDELREYNRRKQAEYRAKQRAKLKSAKALPGEAAFVKLKGDGATEEALSAQVDSMLPEAGQQ